MPNPDPPVIIVHSCLDSSGQRGLLLVIDSDLYEALKDLSSNTLLNSSSGVVVNPTPTPRRSPNA